MSHHHSLDFFHTGDGNCLWTNDFGFPLPLICGSRFTSTNSISHYQWLQNHSFFLCLCDLFISIMILAQQWAWKFTGTNTQALILCMRFVELATPIPSYDILYRSVIILCVFLIYSSSLLHGWVPVHGVTLIQLTWMFTYNNESTKVQNARRRISHAYTLDT